VNETPALQQRHFVFSLTTYGMTASFIADGIGLQVEIGLRKTGRYGCAEIVLNRRPAQGLS